MDNMIATIEARLRQGEDQLIVQLRADCGSPANAVASLETKRLLA